MKRLGIDEERGRETKSYHEARGTEAYKRKSEIGKERNRESKRRDLLLKRIEMGMSESISEFGKTRCKFWLLLFLLFFSLGGGDEKSRK